MGRITSGEFNIYGKGKDQIDVATQNRLNNPNGSHTTLGVLGATLLPQLISGCASNFANAADNNKNSSSVEKDNVVTSESLDKEINDKLTEVGCTDINAIYSELQKKEALLPELNNAITKAQENLTNLQKDLQELEGTLSDAKAEITVLEQLKADGSPEFDVSRYEYLTEILPAQIEKVKNEQIPAAEKVLEEASAVQKPVEDRVIELKEAKKYLEPRIKQRDELKLKNAVDQFKNDESKKILNLITKLNKETNNEKRFELARQLSTAVETYYSKHNVGECPTIDNLPAAKNYLAVKNFKPDTTELDKKVAELGLGFTPRKFS